MHAYLDTHARTHACRNAQLHSRTCVWTHTHTHTHTHTNTHKHKGGVPQIHGASHGTLRYTRPNALTHSLTHSLNQSLTHTYTQASKGFQKPVSPFPHLQSQPCKTEVPPDVANPETPGGLVRALTPWRRLRTLLLGIREPRPSCDDSVPTHRAYFPHPRIRIQTTTKQICFCLLVGFLFVYSREHCLD